MKRFIQSLIALAFIGVAGCASVPAPETPREILAATEVTFVGVVTTAGTLYDHGVISQEELQGIAVQLRGIAFVLDEANAVITSPVSSQNDLDRIVLALRSATTALNAISLDLKTAQQERIPAQ